MYVYVYRGILIYEIYMREEEVIPVKRVGFLDYFRPTAVFKKNFVILKIYDFKYFTSSKE